MFLISLLISKFSFMDFFSLNVLKGYIFGLKKCFYISLTKLFPSLQFPFCRSICINLERSHQGLDFPVREVFRSDPKLDLTLMIVWERENLKKYFR